MVTSSADIDMHLFSEDRLMRSRLWFAFVSFVLVAGASALGCGGDDTETAGPGGPTGDADAGDGAGGGDAGVIDAPPDALVNDAGSDALVNDAQQDAGACDDGDSGTSFTGSTADELAKRTDVLLSASRIPQEDWAAAQAKVAGDPSWANWVKSRKAALDDWMKVPRDRADLIGGYMHDYNDPNTGIPLTWTPASPEPPDGGTEAEVRFKRAWVFYVRSYNLVRTGEAARVFALTGDVKYGDWAASQLDLYATNYNLWPLRTDNGLGRMFQHGLDEATGVWNLLDAARLLDGYASAARVTAWRTGLFESMAENLKTVTSPLTNVGLWQMAGIAGIAMRLDDAALLDYALDNPIGVRATLAASMNADYLWDEGSFGYNEYVIQALARVQDTAGVEGYASVVEPDRTSLSRLLLSPLDYRFDDDMLPGPGDQNLSAGPSDVFASRAYFYAYRSLPTWWGVNMVIAGQSWEALVDAPPATPPTPTLPMVTTRHFPGNRMAVLRREGEWQAFVHYGQARGNHWQEEALTYELHHASTRITGDSGTVNYGSPYHNDYFRKAPAQNVPLIDGLGQEKWGPGEVEFFAPCEARLAVKHPAYRTGVAVSREFEVTSQAFIERTSLEVGDKTERRLGVVFHSDCNIAALSGLTPNPAAAAIPANASTAYWSDVTAYAAAAKWSLELDCAGEKYEYVVSGPTSQTVYFATEPKTPLPKTRPLVYYEATESAASFEASITAH